MFGESLLNTPTPALLREILERASTQGQEQRDAFSAMQSAARLAVSEMVTLFLENGCRPDRQAVSSPYANDVTGYWVLRRYRGAGQVSNYGGGDLYENSITGGSRDYHTLVADGNKQLTIGESYSNPDGPLHLIHPDHSLRSVFNVDALLASPALCNTVLKEVIQDVAATTTRVFSGRRS